LAAEDGTTVLFLQEKKGGKWRNIIQKKKTVAEHSKGQNKTGRNERKNNSFTGL
jgi:hypothetical protein